MKEYSSAEYFKAWTSEGGSYESLREQAPDLIQTVDFLLQSEAFIGQRTFIRERDGEIVLEPDIIFHVNDNCGK